MRSATSEEVCQYYLTGVVSMVPSHKCSITQPVWHLSKVHPSLPKNIMKSFEINVEEQSKKQKQQHKTFFQKNTAALPPSTPSPLFSFKWILTPLFLTVFRSVAQSVFNASQGVRDMGFLSWTPLSVFPPQVSVSEGKMYLTAPSVFLLCALRNTFVYEDLEMF